MQFPNVGLLPNTVQVSAFRVGAGFCNLNTLWATQTTPPNTVLV